MDDANIIGMTSKPSSFAFNAAMGSTSVMNTRAPNPEARFAIPFPT